jgi:hypothetical protein
MARAKEVFCRTMMPGKSFQVRSCQVNQRLKELPLFSLSSHCMPESLKDLMAFPPVGEIVEIDPISIGIGF